MGLFVVMVQISDLNHVMGKGYTDWLGVHERLVGPFYSFETAEANAKEWDTDGFIAYVLPIEEHKKKKPWTPFK